MKNYLTVIIMRFVNLFKNKLKIETYLKIKFFITLGYKLDLNNPLSFNEKLQWIKLNYHNSLMTICCDKVLVKDYVKAIIGKEFIIPTIEIWDNPENIDFNVLPSQFVIKCNHNSGKGMIVCENKNNLNYTKAKEKIISGFDENFYTYNYEWPYKNIIKKIIVEEYLKDEDGTGLIDYKFYCFDGEPTYLVIASNRKKGVKFDYFDIDLNPLPFQQGGKKAFYDSRNIKNYKQMVEIAKKIAKGFPHVRVDLYNIDGKIYFGEMTFFDSGGFGKFKPRKWDYIFGNKINLPVKKGG